MERGALSGLAVRAGARCCRRRLLQGPARAWWLGFAVFGWISVHKSFEADDSLAPKHPAQMLLDAAGPNFFQTGKPIAPPAPFDDGRYFVAWHCLWAILAAVLGGALAVSISGSMAELMGEGGAGISATARCRRNRRSVGAGFWFAGLALAMTVSFGSRLLGAPCWAVGSYFLTWLLFQLAALRAFLGPESAGTDGSRVACWEPPS